MNSCVNLLFSSETMPLPTFMVGFLYTKSIGKQAGDRVQVTIQERME
ncbi:hypothetical protein SSUJS14_0794 [Streptococcus suis JS14]|nr:hypothetical protein SSUJS14_0794 [Streptococcus suis JS14]